MYIGIVIRKYEILWNLLSFRGVKLTFVPPIVLVIIAYLQRFPLWKGRMINSKEEAKKFVVEFLTMDVKFYVFFVMAALGGVAWVFVTAVVILAGVPVPGFELMLRRFLENTLYARPREKSSLLVTQH